MKAVIMAGGKGTRLGDIARDIPKPMVNVGGKPVLEHQVELLLRYGVRDIVIITGHLAESIESYFGDGEKWGVSISYFREPKPLGTVGGLKEIEHLLTEDFLLLYGDVMIDMNLARFIGFHREKGSECTLALHPNDHPYDSDLVEIDAESRITAFHPKPRAAGTYYRNLVNAGAYAMSPAILPMLEQGKEADFGRDVFPKLHQHMKCYGYITAEYLKDMGTPDRLAEVERDYSSGKMERMNREHQRSAIFLDRDGVLNEGRGLIHRPEDLILLPGAAEAVKRINESEYLAVVITNQSVVARNLCTLEGLDAIHKKLDTDLGERQAKLDGLYFCPHHPDAGYAEENPAYKIDCECRKPKPGMLLQAAKDFNIDLARSWMVGDSERDRDAAHAAGAAFAGIGGDSGAPEGMRFATLGEAVSYILNVSPVA